MADLGIRNFDTTTERCHDPRMVFCDGVMTSVLGKLDVCSISMARAVNSEWLTVASSDHLWASKCAELWQGKAHIPRISKVHGLSQMKATLLSIKDGKRNRITRDDLCDHAWEFHFSEVWKNNYLLLSSDCTYVQAEPRPLLGAPGVHMRRYFHYDGTITAEPNDRIWGGHETSFTVIPGTLCGGTLRGHFVTNVCREKTGLELGVIESNLLLLEHP